MTRQIAELFRTNDRFVILSHVDPDGDALGSALGLAAILRAAGKTVDVAVPGGTPRLYRFLPGADRVGAVPDDVMTDPDLIVAVDASSPSRLAHLEPLLSIDAPVLNIDHHGDNSRYGDTNWVDSTACAAALMIQELAVAENLPIPLDAAIGLYVGILTDTGRFTFANADNRGIVAAADLVGRGADPHRIATAIYERHTASSVRLLGQALSTLDLREDGKIACLHVTRAMVEEAGARDEDADGFSVHARSLDGVLVGVFLREAEGGNIKVSFRSNEGVEIDGVASRFGGGGHPRASGARVPGPIEEAKESILGAVSEHLRNGGV